MTQRISVLFGELITDAAVHRAVPLPAGVYEGLEPSLSGLGGNDGWTVTLATGTRGISIWRTAGLPFLGSHTIYEDGPVSVHLDGPGVKPRIDLVVGAHRWVEGPVDASTGYPTGVFTSDMLAIYGVVKGDPSDTPVAPALPIPFDVTGRRATILAQVLVPVTGTPLVSRWPQTDLRFGRRGLPLGDATLDEMGWIPAGQIPPIARPMVVANFAGLRALTPLQHTALALVVGTGIYQYDQSATLAETAVTVIKPTAADGRWIQVMGAATSGTTDTLPPVIATISINGSTASADVTDNVGVIQVDFLVDGVIKGTASKAPWQATLDLSSLTGQHVLLARAQDAAGNVTTSTPLPFTAGGSGSVDSQPPSISVSVSGTSGNLTLSANATDNVGVTKVEFQVDGTLKGTLNAGPWTLTLDSTTLTNGTHTLVARAYDAAGNMGTSAPVSFNVTNGDTWGPVVTWNSPANLSSVSGPFKAQVTATDTLGIVSVAWYLNGAKVGQQTAPASGSNTNGVWSIDLDATSLDPGVTFQVEAIALGTSGNSSGVSVNLHKPDTLAPTITVQLLPVTGTTRTYQATVHDNVGVARVEWRFDSVLKATTTTEPHQFSVDTAPLADGTHTVEAKAFDAEGNSAQTSNVIVVDSTHGPNDPNCFVAGTWVLTPSGPRRIEELRVGDQVLTIPELAHQQNVRVLVPADVEAVHHHRHAIYPILKVSGIGVTAEHPWATPDMAWTRTDHLSKGTKIRGLRHMKLGWIPIVAPKKGKPVSEVINLSVRKARTYMVSAHPGGPFLLVHNRKIM
jgi:hypothetical protein